MAISASVATLAKGVANSMFVTNLTTPAVVTLVVGLVAGGTVVLVDFGAKGDGEAPGLAPPVAGAQEPPAEAQPVLSAEELQRQARQAAEALDDPLAKAVALVELGRGQLQRGEREAGLATLREAREVAKRIPRDAQPSIDYQSIFETEHPLLSIARAQANAEAQDEALETLRQLVDFVRGETDEDILRRGWARLTRIWLTYLGRTDIESLLEPYRAFAEATNQLERPGTRAEFQAFAGNFEEALRIIRESEAFQQPAGQINKRETLFNVAGELRPEDEDFIDLVLDDAKATILDNPDNPAWMRLGALRLARIEADLGRLEDAQETIRRVEAAVETTFADDAIPLKNELPEDRVLYSLKGRKANVLLNIAREQLDAGAHELARENIDNALQLVESLKQIAPPESQEHLEVIERLEKSRAARLYSRLGDFDEATGIASALDPFYGVQLFTESIAEDQRRAGDEAGAEATRKQALDVALEELHRLRANPPDPEDESVQPDDINTHRILIESLATQVIPLQGTLGDVEGALRTIDALEGARQEWAWLELIAARAEAEDLETVAALLDRIESPDFRTKALIRAAASLLGPKE